MSFNVLHFIYLSRSIFDDFKKSKEVYGSTEIFLRKTHAAKIGRKYVRKFLWIITYEKIKWRLFLWYKYYYISIDKIIAALLYLFYFLNKILADAYTPNRPKGHSLQTKKIHVILSTIIRCKFEISVS